MLISPETLLASIAVRRCAVSGVVLADDEFIVSLSAFPRLYRGGKDIKEANLVAEILFPLNEILGHSDVTEVHREEIRRFLIEVNGNGYFRSERSLHLYFFHFWQHLWLSQDDEIDLRERYYEGDSRGDSRFAQKLMPLLCTEQVRIDIVGLGGYLARNLYLVEVKVGDLDDRAVGQILRYYSHARTQCDRVFHDCDIRQVIPVLIVEAVRLEFWQAIPLHFRELLQIYRYSVDTEKKRIYLRDAKAMLSTQARHLIYRSA